MNEIEYKLSSNNTILITHGISKILETVKDKLTSYDNDNDAAKISELRSLFMKCKSDNAVVSSVACQSLVSLVERGHLEISLTLSKLIAILGETKNYLAITSSICNLLILDLKQKKIADNYKCPYSIKAPQHPLITVLSQNTDAWRIIISQMQSILYHCQPEHFCNHVELLRPVFMYVLCNPAMTLSENCRQQTWHLLIRTSGTLMLQLEIIQWLQTNNLHAVINTNNVLLEFAELAIMKKNPEFCTAIAPLVMALLLHLLKNNYDPRSNIVVIESIIEHSDNCIGSILVSLLSEMVLITPVIYLYDLIHLGQLILRTLSCNEVVAYVFISSILPWMAYATPLSSEALDIGKECITSITSKFSAVQSTEKIYANDIFRIICHADDSVQFYTSLTMCSDDFTDDTIIVWLQKLSNSPSNYLCRYKNLLGGIFLKFTSFSIISSVSQLLLKIAKINITCAGYILSLVLYKISNIENTKVMKTVMFMLPELAVSKENVPIIIHTLQTLFNADEPLNYLAINIYLKAWMVDPRCHRHLLSALIEMSKNDKTTLGRITCAKAMKFICETKPEHGTELVPLLSQTLNHCTDAIGSAPSALALGGISALCVTGIADVCSTWRVLSPKINKEDRPIVIKSICQFLADIPLCPIHNGEEHDNLINQVLTKLWEFSCYETTRNIEVVEAAFKALAAYAIGQMNLTVLPEVYKTNLQLPQKYAKSTSNEEKKLEDMINYIPSTCWTTMLETIAEPVRSLAGDLLIKFISDELYGFKTGIYMWSIGEPINYKYLPEKSPVRAIGEYLRRYNSITHSEKPKIILECLRIFSHKYRKALPPIKWELLNSAINMSDEARLYGVSLACHQAIVSPTAKEFLSKYITEVTNNCTGVNLKSEKFNDCWHLCSNLEDVSRGVMSTVLGPFLEVVFACIVDKAISNDEIAVDMFNKLMERCANVLRDDLVHYDNKTLVTSNLEKLLDNIDVESEIFPAFVEAMLQISTEQIERITLPSVWTEITIEKLKKAIHLRAGLVLKRDNEIPLSWMNEIIRVSASIPGVYKCLLENLLKIQSQLRGEKSNANWTWDLMCRIQATIVNINENNQSSNSITFLCDTLFVTVITLNCDNCLIIDDEPIITSHEMRSRLFPHALVNLLNRPHWKDICQQTMEWLNSLRASNILPNMYKIVFHNALVSLKNEKYLDDMWTNYLSIKSPM